MKAQKMATIYEYAFSKVAKKFKIYIVAGSIILPAPKIVDGHLEIGKGPLRNVSVVFAPDGLALPDLTTKNFPSLEERNFVSGGNEPFPVYQLPLGPTSILISEDAWYQANHDQVIAKGASIVLTPAYLTKNEPWDSKWDALNPLPGDIDPADIGSISTSEAWHKYSLSRNKSGTSVGLFMSGQLWDIGSDGKSFVYIKGQIREVPEEKGPYIFNTWIY